MFRRETKSDARVVRRILGGNRDEFEILVQRYMGSTYGVAYAFTGNADDADDVVQETFLRAFLQLDTLREPAKFGSWLLIIARNAAHTFTKKRLREKEAVAHINSEEREQLPDVEQRELREVVRRQVMQLDEGAREILLLRYFSGKSVREVAAMLDITTNAAKMRLQRARNSLGKRLLREIEMGNRQANDGQIRRLMGAIGATAVGWGSAAEANASASSGGVMGIVQSKSGMLSFVTLGVVIAVGLAMHATNEQSAMNPTDDPGVGGESTLVVPEEIVEESMEPIPVKLNSAGATPATESVVTPEVAPLSLSSISGVVMTRSGRPLEAARVTASGSLQSDIWEDPRRRFNFGTSVTIDEHQSSPYYAEALTDAAGNFTLEGLAYTHYTIRVTPPNANTQTDRSYEVMQPEMKDSIDLKEGENRHGVRLTYDEGSAIWGMVTDADGKPVPETRVAVIQRVGGENHTMSYIVEPDGSYLADGLIFSEEHPRLRAEAPGYMRTPDKRVPLESAVDFLILPSPRISGQVVRADTGEPATAFSYRRLATWELNGDIEQTIARWAYDDGIKREDPEGRFEIELKQTGDTGISIRTPDGFIGFERLEGVHVGQIFEDVTIRVHPLVVETIEVVGQVINTAGTPVAGAWVFDVSRYTPWESMYSGDLLEQVLDEKALAKSDENGRFSFEAPTRIRGIVTYYPEYALDTTLESFSIDTPNEVEIVLGTGGTITGVVRLDGDPLTTGEASVSARNLTQIDSNGSYALERVPPGLVTIDCNLHVADAKSANVAFKLRKQVRVEDGQTQVIDFHFERGYDARVEGTILLSGAPFASARVNVQFDLADGLQASFTTDSDEEGRYWIDQLPEGPFLMKIVGVSTSGKGLGESFEMEAISGETVTYDVELIESAAGGG